MSRRHLSGFSLVELLVYFAIVAIVGVIFVNVLLIMLQSRSQLHARARVHQNLNFALLRIAQDVRAATALEADEEEQLVLTMNDDEKSTRTLTYEDGVIYMQKDEEEKEALLTDDVELTAFVVSSLRTELSSNAGVRIELALRYRDEGDPHAQFHQSFATSIYLRN